MSYHLLLVDDEVHAIEGVKADLDLEALRISQLFVAYNSKQAKEYLENERIDIMLCDIEMPQGSGLDLLAWVNGRQSHTVTIFLTSYADFKYAKEALQLGSLDYLLKPVLPDELERVIRKAQKEIDRNGEIHQSSQAHQLWMKHHSLIIERFWLDLINQTIPSHAAAIRAQIEQQQLPLTPDMSFFPILISVQKWNKELNRRDEKIMEYALKNSAEEVFLKNDTNGMFIYIDRSLLLGIMTTNVSVMTDDDQMVTSCEQYIEMCNRYFYCDVSCYLGQPVAAYQMAEMTAVLRKKVENNVAFYNRVFTFDAELRSERKPVLPELNVWISLLKTGTKQSIITEVENFVHQLVQSQAIDAKVLRQFHQDFMQALYAYLNVEGIQAHRLFGDEESISLSDQAGRSVRDLLLWVHHAVNKATHQAEKVKKSDTVVQSVQRYIAQYLDQDLSRESIAEMVFLNPDHLSRLFKKETGYSISDYILMERIKRAKELLSQTNIPISSIAASVGHTNFSHFARIFKKYVGVGPSEFRSLHVRVEGSDRDV
ncbi:response regulator [Paenibacillus sp.]|uniref:response regulator n=1 Tax=Paenibacillus sp. TaxID=58172 RepID=UPI002D658F2C|nr:response regulator [Paenibacillus sp.]HZG87992.1 response regulator [Paenibacillus sp.]